MTSRLGRALALAACALALLTASTIVSLAPLPRQLPPAKNGALAPRLVSSDGADLTRAYGGPWNVHDRVTLARVPPMLQAAFIGAEDRRFARHRGIDWIARGHALVQNLRAGRKVRGASTISEQVVRMLVPRPRGIWARWLEGFDAMRAEQRYGKAAMLEFYLNQVPFAARRRGVVQAARYYFGRGLDTLSPREMMALAVMVRAPSRLDPRTHPAAVQRRVVALAAHLRADGWRGELATDVPLDLAGAPLDVEAPHFVRFVRSRTADAVDERAQIVTTLSASLQRHVAAVLDQRLGHLARRDVAHAAALVVDRSSGAIRAWAVASSDDGADAHIDAVVTPRQPGSTLKPFVYALALDSGLSAATMFHDRPLMQRVGAGMHRYHNYSRRHYGQVSLRDALGSSLNIPAVEALTRVGSARMLERLRALGMHSLVEHPEIYGDGIALGNGAVTLLELVQAYATLANAGRRIHLHWREDATNATSPRVFSAEASSLIADILSDDHARRLEFGTGSVLSMPRQTAVKTGTSSDHRDAWAIGFDHQHVVGVWMGNLDQRPMNRVSGATGPALVLRSVFAELNRDRPPRALYLSPHLERHRICIDSGRRAHAGCQGVRDEWFAPGTAPSVNHDVSRIVPHAPRIVFPASGAMLAIDPRLPRALQRVVLRVEGTTPGQRVYWRLDDRSLPSDGGSSTLWTLTPGAHRLEARTEDALGRVRVSHTVRFTVRDATTAP